MGDGYRFERLTAEEKSAVATALHLYILLTDAGSKQLSVPIVKRAEMQRDCKILKEAFTKLFVEDDKVIPLN